MKWNGEAEEALGRLIEGRGVHERARAEGEARHRIEERARQEKVEEIDASLVISTYLSSSPPDEREDIKKVIRALGLKTEQFF
jgi:hypothetical protein